tara:strand:+ start:1966 stop:2529 length:564 start_codon:yes stop_codon:yes gene_type:complete
MLLLKVIIVLLVLILLMMFSQKESFDGENNDYSNKINLSSLYDGNILTLYWFIEPSLETTDTHGDFKIYTQAEDKAEAQDNLLATVKYDEKIKFYIKTIILKEKEDRIIIIDDSRFSNIITIDKTKTERYDTKKHIDHKIQCYPDGSHGTVLDCVGNSKFPSVKNSSLFYKVQKIVNTLIKKNIVLQ